MKYPHLYSYFYVLHITHFTLFFLSKIQKKFRAGKLKGKICLFRVVETKSVQSPQTNWVSPQCYHGIKNLFECRQFRAINNVEKLSEENKSYKH